MPDSLIVNEIGQRKIQFERAWDYNCLREYLSCLELQHSCIRVRGIGESMLGRALYAVTLGEDDTPGVLYVGGIGARDTQSPATLLRFVADYAEFLERGKRMYGVNLTYLNKSRSITVIPLLNPDGGAIVHGNDHPLHRIDVQPEAWTGNGRNADLMTDFEAGCREAEACAVTGYVRTMGNMEMCLSFHPEEKGISFAPQAHRAVPVGRLLSRMIGCEVNKSARGLAQWFTVETTRPAYTCATFEDSTTQPDDYISLYAALREALFSMPLLL